MIERHHGELVSIEHPTTTLEELFLSIVRDSEARPGRRAVGYRRPDGRSRRISYRRALAARQFADSSLIHN